MSTQYLFDNYQNHDANTAYEQLRSPHVANLLDCVPSLIWFKDLDCNYIQCNKHLLNLIKIPERQNLLGKNDHDLPWEKYANTYQTHDKKVMAEKNINCFIMPGLTYDLSTSILVVGRVSPLYDLAGNSIGISGSANCITTQNIVKEITNLYSNDIDAFGIPPGCHQYYFSDEYERFGLTKREAQCLFFIIRGKTAKYIASVLDLSIRTVEAYIQNIKDKLDCRNKSNLIDKAIEIGFVSYLPDYYLQSNQIFQSLKVDPILR